MGGSAYAAHRYVITSTNQIAPKALKALRGKPGRPGRQGPAGGPGAQGASGPQGPAGQAGTARAYTQVVTNDPVNPSYDQNHGFPGRPRRVGIGVLCVPAPPGVDAGSTPVFVSLSGASAGQVSVASNNDDCRAGEFEVLTANSSQALQDHILFNILVP
jgi:hypothetical protein